MDPDEDHDLFTPGCGRPAIDPMAGSGTRATTFGIDDPFVRRTRCIEWHDPQGRAADDYRPLRGGVCDMQDSGSAQGKVGSWDVKDYRSKTALIITFGPRDRVTVLHHFEPPRSRPSRIATVSSFSVTRSSSSKFGWEEPETFSGR